MFCSDKFIDCFFRHLWIRCYFWSYLWGYGFKRYICKWRIVFKLWALIPLPPIVKTTTKNTKLVSFILGTIRFSKICYKNEKKNLSRTKCRSLWMADKLRKESQISNKHSYWEKKTSSHMLSLFYFENSMFSSVELNKKMPQRRNIIIANLL